MQFTKGGSTMARKARPWYHSERRAWMAVIGGRRVLLCPADRKTKKPPKEAEDRLADLLHEARHNPAPELTDKQTVASVIERYMEVGFPSLSEGSRSLRKPYLESFAELHGFRL